MREHRVTIRRGTGRVNLKQQSTGIEGLVPQYFDVSFYIVKLVLYNLIQTDVFIQKNTNFLAPIRSQNGGDRLELVW